MKKRSGLKVLLFTLASLQASLIYATPEGFVTIIGPDGLPLVVPYKQSKQAQSSKDIKSEPQLSVPTSESDIVLEKSKTIIKPVPKTITKENVSLAGEKQQNLESTKINPTEDISKSAKPIANTQSQPYKEIDGEKYYEAEYLESKEFNLEEKNRFYQIPMSAGGGNWDVIERNKGIDMSWFNLRNQQKENTFETVVLGTNYAVLDKLSIEQALPNKCLDEKALKKAKNFDKDSISLWPRAPFKDEFDYELVSIKDRSMQNFKLSSYAKSDREKIFYWPLVVFLDSSGCVIEGASGYFTKGYAATPLQTEVLEGNLQVPKHTHYMLFTPLTESIDLPNTIMSNQGQVTLRILR